MATASISTMICHARPEFGFGGRSRFKISYVPVKAIQLLGLADRGCGYRRGATTAPMARAPRSKSRTPSRCGSQPGGRRRATVFVGSQHASHEGRTLAELPCDRDRAVRVRAGAGCRLRSRSPSIRSQRRLRVDRRCSHCWRTWLAITAERSCVRTRSEPCAKTLAAALSTLRNPGRRFRVRGGNMQREFSGTGPLTWRCPCRGLRFCKRRMHRTRCMSSFEAVEW